MTLNWRRNDVSAYVGLTRAQRRIVLTSAARRRVYGDYQSTEPSRFIDEIPAELVDEAPSTFVSSPSSFAPFRASPYPRGGGYRGKAAKNLRCTPTRTRISRSLQA
jgi:DNA helicase-2/ATP-dependent DNA helicase PcrA